MVGLAGKSLAARQVDFALAAGAERIFLLGNGGAETKAVCDLAERSGAKVQVVANAHGLLGSMSATDELLVLSPGLLPESSKALILLEKGSSVLVLPAAQGIPAGFERIDLERAWGGALVVPGGLVERLAELPQDFEPASALLRIALQARTPERRLSEVVLADGSWTMLDGASAARDEAWLARKLPLPPANQPSRRLAHFALQRSAFRLMDRQRAVPAMRAATVVLLAAGVGLAAAGLAPVGFALVALGALSREFTGAFSQLAAAPFGTKAGNRSRILLEALAEAALLATAILAIEGDWMHRLFPPLALIGLLHAVQPRNWPGLAAAIGDVAVLAAVLALASAFGLAEPAIMLLVLGIIGREAAKTLASRG